MFDKPENVLSSNYIQLNTKIILFKLTNLVNRSWSSQHFIIIDAVRSELLFYTLSCGFECATRDLQFSVAFESPEVYTSILEESRGRDALRSVASSPEMKAARKKSEYVLIVFKCGISWLYWFCTNQLSHRSLSQQNYC